MTLKGPIHIIVGLLLAATNQVTNSERVTESLHTGWRFHLGDKAVT